MVISDQLASMLAAKISKQRRLAGTVYRTLSPSLVFRFSNQTILELRDSVPCLYLYVTSSGVLDCSRMPTNFPVPKINGGFCTTFFNDAMYGILSIEYFEETPTPARQTLLSMTCVHTLGRPIALVRRATARIEGEFFFVLPKQT